MLGLASRAMKSEAISRLIDEQLRENEKFRSHFLKALRTSYSISVLLLLLVVFIYGILSRLSRLPHPSALVMGWSPAFFSAWALLQMLTFIRLLAALAMNKVECFYRELEATGNGITASTVSMASTEVSMPAVLVWRLKTSLRLRFQDIGCIF